MQIYKQLTKEQIESVQKGFFAAKQEGYAGVAPFLQEEMNVDKKACYFFAPHAFASAFYPNKTTAETTGFFLPHRMPTSLIPRRASAVRISKEFSLR